MNAIYARPDGEVIDPLGGMKDLLARRVRFVGDAETRIQEDYLRILRFFRFTAWFGDPEKGMDAGGLAACATHSAGIETLSGERVGAEMRKLLAADNPALAVAAMAQAGVLAAVLPGSDHTALAPLVHLERGIAPRWLRRLAVLGGQDATGRLRLSRSEARNLAALRSAALGGEVAAVLGWTLGEELGRDAILCRAALMGEELRQDCADEVIRGASAAFPVKAADLPGLQGAKLGERLQALQDRWLKSGLRLTKSQLLD